MGDLSDPRFIGLKAALFVALGISAGWLLWLHAPSFVTALLIGLTVWAFARAYYYAFYVIEHYVDPAYRFDGLWAFARYRLRGRVEPHEVDEALRSPEAVKRAARREAERRRNRRALIVAGAFASLVVVCVAAIAVGQSTRNGDYVAPADGITIGVYADAAHSELILPLRTGVFDWREHLRPAATVSGGPTHVAIGWGDEGFYMHTPTWAELDAGRALAAALWPTPTVMRVTLRGPPADGPTESTIRLSLDAYERLAKSVAADFETTRSGAPIRLGGARYAEAYRVYRERGFELDFYRARGAYTALYTCNTWTSEKLALAGLPTARWTPFTRGVFRRPAADAASP